MITFSVTSSIQAAKSRRLAEAEREARVSADATAARLAAEFTVSNIERGRALASEGNLRAAEELVWREHLKDPQSNHSFWALWSIYSHNPTLAARGTPDRNVNAIAFAPDGRTFASAGDDALLRIWTTDTIQCMGTLPGYTDILNGRNSLCFSPDGKHLASASNDGTIIVWDLASHEAIHTLRGNAGKVHGVLYAPDGKHLVSGVGDGAILVWDATTGDCVGVLTEHTRAVHTLSFNRDGSLLASGSEDDTIKLWRNLAGPSIATLSGHTDGVWALAFSPDGRTLASGGGYDKNFWLWDLMTYECLDTICAANGTPQFLQFTPEGDTLIVGGWWRLDAWDLTSRTRRRVAGHGARGAVSPDGRFLAAACVEYPTSRNSIRVVETAPHPGMLRLGGTDGKGTASVSPDGRMIASGNAAGFVQLWETATGHLLATLPTHTSRWSSSHFDPSGKFLATCSSDGLVKLWDLSTGNLVNSSHGHHSATRFSLSFSPDGRKFASTRQDGTIQIREVPTCRVVASVPAADTELLSVRYSPDGRMLAAAHRRKGIRLFTVRGEPLGELDTSHSPWTVAFNPNGTKLAVSGWGKRIQIWDLATNTLELRLAEQKAAVWEAAYMPGNPNILASCSAGGIVQLWDLREERSLLKLDPFSGSDALSVSFTPDGKTLIAAGYDGSLCVWDLEYFERHMAGNLDFHVELLRPELDDAIQTEYLAQWADEVMSRPWPRMGPHANTSASRPIPIAGLPGTDLELIAVWGANRPKAPQQ